MLQPKKEKNKTWTDWLNRQKNEAHMHVFYNRPTSDLGTYTDWKWGNRKKYFMQTDIFKKLEEHYSYQNKQTSK